MIKPINTPDAAKNEESLRRPLGAEEVSLGIDIGSAYVAVAAVDAGGDLLRHAYRRHEGNVVETVRDLLSDIGTADIASCAKTGTGAEQIINAGPSLDPTVSLLYGAKSLYPDIRNVLYIGAGSFYLVVLNDKGEYLKHTANTACASGTGAFLDQQAIRLGAAPEKLHELAAQAKSCPSVATRCAVFAKTDIIHLQQAGFSREDISAGICRGMAESTMDVLMKGKTLHGKTAVVGGVSRNAEIVKYVEKKIGFSVDVPEHPELVGAIGAAAHAAAEPDALPDLTNVAKAEVESAQRLRKPALRLEKSNYPEFKHFDFRINDDGTEIALMKHPDNKTYDVVMGIDIGSTSTKAVIVTKDGEPLLTTYRKTAGEPIRATQLILRAIREEAARYEFDLNILATGTTGSGRKLIKKVIRADAEMNEITAHARAAVHLDPEVDTILEIGGQDAKFTQLDNGVVYNSVMNYVCAAGTGSFIEEQAKRLGIPIWDYGDDVLGVSPPKTSDRCTVFMERDLDLLLSQGWSKNEVAAAVLYSVCENYLNKVVAGQHIGERVYFQGATARNKALVAAFEQTLKKPITVSPLCHLTGAYGIALILLDEGAKGSSFRGLDFCDAKVTTTSEKCTLCINDCDLTIVGIEGEKVGWGMKCGRDYEDVCRPAERNPHYHLFRYRNKLLKELSGKDPENPAFTVGLPMSLTSYGRLPLWGTFLRQLGGKVVTSGKTTGDTLKQGLHYTQAEFCAPIIAGHGHAAKLARSDLDFVFIPHMIHAEPRKGFDGSHFCPFVQSHPSVVRASNIFEGYDGVLLAPIVKLEEGVVAISRALYDEVGSHLGVTRQEIRSALEAGLAEQQKFNDLLKEEGRKVVDELERTGETGIVILGRPYNVNDGGLNVDLPKKIADMGVTVVPIDCLDEGTYEKRWQNMYWNYGQTLVLGARKVVDSDNLFGIMFSNFCCGPDSYIITYFKEIMAERRKPFLVVQFDAHGADAGYVTRVEAALQSFKTWKPTPAKRTTPVKELKKIDKSRIIFFPPMDPITVEFFAAAFIGEGYKAEVLREDDETLDVGYRHTLGGECVPCPTTIGSFIKTVEDRNLSPSEVSLFMPTASGPCRFGQYNCLNQLIFDRKGWKDIEIISPSSTNAYVGLPVSLRKNLWKGILCGDILSKMLLKTRPHETTPGSADKALSASIADICDGLRSGSGNMEGALASAVEHFKKVKYVPEPRPKVGIVGEIYVRNASFINQDVVRWIERFGGEALKTSISEWILYSAMVHESKASRSMKGLASKFKSKLQSFYFSHVEHGFYDIAKDIIHDRPEPDVEEIVELGRQYVPFEFEGEAILTIGRALYFIEQEGVDAIVNASPTFCMPGTTTTSIFARIEEEKGVPIICNFYDGSGEPNKVLRPHLHCLSRR